MIKVTLLLSIFVASLAAPQSDLIVNLPGTPAEGFNFKQYSGYLDLHGGQHYHYYFTESQNNPSQSPLILWLNGGPGCSSMAGLLIENGPFSVGENGQLVKNQWAWNRLANIIYLESPAGVGWSWSEEDSPSYDDRRTADENYRALEAWFAKFPEYANNPLYVMGESYAGHYVPQLSALILSATASKPNVPPQSNFKGFATGNPVSENKYDFDGTWLNKFLKTHGMLSLDDEDTQTNAQGNYDPYDILDDVCPTGSDLSLMDYIRFDHPLLAKTGHLKRYVANRPACANNWTTTWANTKEVAEALHVRTDIQWKICGGPTYNGGVPSVLNIYRKFSKLPRYKVLVYSGDEDTVINFLGTERWVLDLKLPITSSWHPWNYNQGFGQQVAGYGIQFNAGARFNYTIIKGAGHMVPWFQPAPAYQMLYNFLNY